MEVGATFPFSIAFQQRLSKEVTALVEPSDEFGEKFGPDWNLMFRISAKRLIPSLEIRGPSAFRKTKDVEFSLFLPFDVLQRELDVERAAMRVILAGVCEVFSKLGIATAKVEEKKESLIDRLCSDTAMFDQKAPNQPPEPIPPRRDGSS